MKIQFGNDFYWARKDGGVDVIRIIVGHVLPTDLSLINMQNIKLICKVICIADSGY